MVPVVRQQFRFDQMGRIVPAPRRRFVGIVGIQRGAARGQRFLRQALNDVVGIIHVRRRGDLVPCGQVILGIARRGGKAGNGAVVIFLRADLAVHGKRDARQIVALVVTELRRADIGVGGVVEDVVTDQSTDAVVIVTVLFDVDAVAVLADRIVRRIGPRIAVTVGGARAVFDARPSAEIIVNVAELGHPDAESYDNSECCKGLGLSQTTAISPPKAMLAGMLLLLILQAQQWVINTSNSCVSNNTGAFLYADLFPDP